VNGAFLRSDTQLLDDVPRIAHLPGVIVQGRYDVVCPAASAWALHRAWPKAKLVIVRDAGHSMKEPGIRSELVQATDDFAGA
jgi:proline iminopeptidase